MKKLLIGSCILLVLALVFDYFHTANQSEILKYAYCISGILGAVGILVYSIMATKKKSKEQ